jgi:hypothetical protein
MRNALKDGAMPAAVKQPVRRARSRSPPSASPSPSGRRARSRGRRSRSHGRSGERKAVKDVSAVKAVKDVSAVSEEKAVAAALPEWYEFDLYHGSSRELSRVRVPAAATVATVARAVTPRTPLQVQVYGASGETISVTTLLYDPARTLASFGLARIDAVDFSLDPDDGVGY